MTERVRGRPELMSTQGGTVLWARTHMRTSTLRSGLSVRHTFPKEDKPTRVD